MPSVSRIDFNLMQIRGKEIQHDNHGHRVWVCRGMQVHMGLGRLGARQAEAMLF